MDPDSPGSHEEPSPHEAERSVRTSLAVNLGGSIVGSVLTLYLAHAMESWPMEETSAILYALIAPLLLVPPLWALVGLVLSAKNLLKQARSGARWTVLAAFAVALALVFAALPVFGASLMRLLRL